MTQEQFAVFSEMIQGGSPYWWSPFLTPLAAIFTAIVASIIALKTISNQRAIAKRGKTIDLIIKFESDQGYQRSIDSFRQLRAGDFSPDQIVNPINDDTRKARNQLNLFWNYHEIMALAIRRDTIDMSLFRRWWGFPFVNVWNESVPTFNKLRDVRSNKRIYQNFEIVARKMAETLTARGYPIEFQEPQRQNKDQPFMIKKDKSV